ncbi:MAG: hypothetical protein E7273_07945 [Pseudobutyrivibrio ruminis]|nr:hypothetical protein [Pseudobutyrivibrio ruminis]
MKAEVKKTACRISAFEHVPLNTSVTQQCCTSCATNTTFEKLSTLKLSIEGITIKITENSSDYLLAKAPKAVRHA